MPLARCLADKQQLQKDREALLNKIGFLWNGMGPPWDYRLVQLLMFRMHEGHCEVMMNFPKPSDADKSH